MSFYHAMLDVSGII